MPTSPRPGKSASPPITPPAKLLTARQVADRLAVSGRTVERLIISGILKLHRVGPRGPRRFRVEDVDRVLIPATSPEQCAVDLDAFITTQTKKG